MNRRVVVTGLAGLCPLGQDWETVRQKLLTGQSGIQLCPEYEEYEGLATRLVAPVPDFERPDHYPRKNVRSMGRVSLFAVRATELALIQAGLLDSPILTGGRTGLAFGSTTGSPPAIETYAQQISVHKTLHGITGAQFVKLMSHTTAANLAQFFGTTGRVLPTCSACTSGSQGIGYAFETIQWGLQDVMVSGGAEELHVICTAVFDIMNATSQRHDEPHRTPRPFDADRDGLVVGEGAGVLILEELEQARARGAHIYAEIVGYATNGDGRHIVNPTREDMAIVMREALDCAGLKPEDIGYVNAHGTATDVGDVVESQATNDVFGERVPVSSLKGHMGHTLGACGALEAWICINMMNEGWLAPTLNLENLDSRCAPLDYIKTVRYQQVDYIMSNNFAFGGVNTSLIFKRWQED